MRGRSRARFRAVSQWELVPEDRGPAPGHLRRFVRSLGRVEHALDLGCGDGRLSAELDAAGLTAADVSSVALERARRRLALRDARFVELEPDAALPLADAAFDLVLCAETLEHVRDVQLLLSALRGPPDTAAGRTPRNHHAGARPLDRARCVGPWPRGTLRSALTAPALLHPAVARHAPRRSRLRGRAAPEATRLAARGQQAIGAAGSGHLTARRRRARIRPPTVRRERDLLRCPEWAGSEATGASIDPPSERAPLVGAPDRSHRGHELRSDGAGRDQSARARSHDIDS